ncbi:MAG: hypothetical protein QMD82_05705 [bacterium]|nr:hypothetical protein [bacterium]
MDKKNFVIGFIGFCVFFSLSLFSFKEETKTLYLYYSAECPHCLKVVNFTLKTEFKRPVVLKEVFYNDYNYEEFVKVVKRSGLDTLRVPAIFDARKNKLVFDEERVIRYLERYIKK